MLNPSFIRMLTCIVAVSGLLVLAGCGSESPQMPPPGVSYLVVKPTPVTLTTRLSGRTSALLVADVRPQVSGIIQERFFEEGSNVEKGAVLYQIDPSLYNAAYQNARAALIRAEATSKAARLLAQRYAELVKVKAVSRQEYDNAAADYERCKAEVIAAQAAVDTAEINLAYTKVMAPVAGSIGRSSVTPGALVTQNQPTALAVIQQVDEMYVDVTQSSQDVMRMRESFGAGSKGDVELIFQDGTRYDPKGRLEFYDITVDPSTDTVNVRIVFPNKERKLLPGMYVSVVITEGVDESGSLIPQKAVFRDQKGSFMVKVLKPAENGLFMVAQTSITVARSVENQWHVTGGLNTGDLVLIDGLQKAPVGATVRGMELGANPASADNTGGSAASPAPKK